MKKIIINNLFAIVCLMLVVVLVYTARVSFTITDEKSDKTIEISGLDNIAFGDYIDLFNNMADEYKEEKEYIRTQYNAIESVNFSEKQQLSELMSAYDVASIAFVCSVFECYLAYLSIILGILAPILSCLLPLFSKKIKKDDFVSKIGLAFPIIAFVALIFPMFSLQNVYSLLFDAECTVSFSFVSGINYIYTAIGGFIVLVVGKFIINKAIKD